MGKDIYNTKSTLQCGNRAYTFYSLKKLAQATDINLDRLPYSIRILLENALRKFDGVNVSESDVLALANWLPVDANRAAVPFHPGRVLMQDFTGVPVIVDLAAMRSAVARLGGDPSRINPVVPVDLVIDHSLQLDTAGLPDSMQFNEEMEYKRNRERYEFLRWGQQAFKNLRIVPPSSGIVHQVNLEYLAGVVLTREEGDEIVVFPDSVVGSDSHTTMVNGLGVVGWGVGGIEAAAAMLGEPLDLVLPDVIGIRLSGCLREGVTPTDLTLTLTQLLRGVGVVNKFIEYFGPGLEALTLPDRAMIANMSPENGSTMAYFPVDRLTLDYLFSSGRPEEQIDLVETYFNEQGLFHTTSSPDPRFSRVIELDLGSIEPSVAGPRRPQDRLPLAQVGKNFSAYLSNPKNEGGLGIIESSIHPREAITLNGENYPLDHGSVVIAAITSCTNTSNPYGMIAAGLLARNAVARGLKVSPTVKTSLTPGSRVVTAYLEKAGLIEPLAQLGFTVAGYGCATCIGNSGPLAAPVEEAIKENKLAVAAVISGNRNFEGRVHPLVQANYLASPALVLAYALAGTVKIDLEHEPLQTDEKGQPVMLRDLWPSTEEINRTIAKYVTAELFEQNYAGILKGDERWQQIECETSALYHWQPGSSYIQEPPFFEGMNSPMKLTDKPMRVLAVVGDSVTTDHISPAGNIPAESAAGSYLRSLGVPVAEFNSYGSRRGNFNVLTRGTLANPRLKNKMLPGVEGSLALHQPDGEKMSLFDAAMKYKEDGVPLLLIAGTEYGTGSSRDWAAKGPLLLGVKAVLAKSFERIHRSNLVGMGILPLAFQNGDNVESLNLTGLETYTIEGLEPLQIGKIATIRAALEGQVTCFKARLCIETPAELAYFRQGGLLPAFVNKVMEK
jgi:aconitate hydratase